jgi:hypothetical protein
MRKAIMLGGLCIAAIALSLSGCMGPEGDVYIQLGWYYTPASMYSTDPSLQRVGYIHPFTNYPTEPGTYYLTYFHTQTGLTHYISYALTAHKGDHFFEQGPDSIFEIYCWENANYPDFMQLKSITATAAGQPQGMTLSGTAPAGKEVQQFEYTQSHGGWDVHVRGGIIDSSQPGGT